MSEQNQKSKIENQQSPIKTVGIIGAGTMGSGIAQVAATADCKVKLFDLNQEALDKAQKALEKILNRLIEKGRIDVDEKNRIQGNIQYVNSLKELADADLTIEAIVENLEIKKNNPKTVWKYRYKTSSPSIRMSLIDW